MSATLTRDMGVRELSIQEIDEVGGGIIPFIIAVVLIDLALIGFTAGVASKVNEAAE
ncbi:MAG: class IIb bacteriocin, lactobin A/cerein 7B family [Robiginitomaculum sp.]|nr:class IIb bacteriocin, lactobin A/cerein 7B family [Robiginitomaculum sp.]